jgi:hypothetical protein
MKQEYKHFRDNMRDVMGRFRTTSLFYETNRNPDKYPSLFSTKDYNHEVKGIIYPSLKNIYLSYDHVPEYEYDFAMDIFGSWDHWLQLFQSPDLKGMVEGWRDELAIRIKAEAMKNIIKKSRSSDPSAAQAAKYLSNEEYKPKTRGRPSKVEIAGNKAAMSRDRETLDADMERLGIKLIK